MKFSQHLLQAILVLGLTHVSAVRADDTADARQLLRDGKPSEALSRVERALSTKPKDVPLRLLKGVIQREAGKVAEATQTFTKLSEEHPELPEPYNNLAAIWAAQGQYDKARVALEKALRTHPSYATAHDNLTEIYGRLAGQAYSRALQLEGTPEPAPAKLALLQTVAVPGVPGAAPATGTQVASTQTSASGSSSATHASNGLPALNNKPVAATPTPVPATPAVVAQAKPEAPTPANTAKPSAPAAATPAAAGASKGAVDNSAEIERVTQAWAKAWSDRNVTKYLAYYDKTFDPPGQQSRSAWEQDRRARILGKSRISVVLSDIQITVSGKRAVAKFRQDYKADALAVSSRKTLEWVLSEDRWLIAKESSGG